MRALFFCVIHLIFANVISAQIGFYDGTSQVLGDEVLKSTICIGFNDINGDLKDDLILMDKGKILKTFTQSAPNQVFDYKLHSQVSFNGDWAIISGDLDNDGEQEIICSGNEFGSQFYRFNGDKYIKQFDTEVIYSQNSNLVDLNNDGFLDFFVCNDLGENLMFINNGNGFMVESKIIDFQTSPTDDMSGNYSSVFTDIDGDDDLDLYIGKCKAGIFDPTDPRRINTLYINNGDGTYIERGAEAGLANGAQSWSVDSGDIDNDGDNDIIVANHDGPHDLMINDGLGNFERKTIVPGGYSSFAFQSFFCDLDNNGWLDIIFTDPSQSFILYNDKMSFTRREVFESGRKAFSVATGDLNSDGFLDLYFGFANSYQEPSDINDKVLINKTNSNNYLDIKLTGSISNRDAVGSKIILYQGENIQTREVVVGKSYGIMNSTIVHFGLGKTNTVDSIQVKWPSGIKTIINDLTDLNILYSVTEDGCVTSNYKMPNLQLCDGQPIDISLPDGFDSYKWSNGSEEKAITVDEIGWYKATMSKDGCTTYTSYFEVTEEVEIQQSDILPEFNQVICEGDVVKLTAYSGSSFQWSTGEDSQTIDIIESGLYAVTVNTNCGVYTSDVIQIEFADVIVPNVENDTVLIGESATLIGDSENLKWYQNKNDIEPIAEGMTFTIPELLESQTYYVGEVNAGFGFEKSLMSNVPLNNVGDSIYTQNEVVEFEVLDKVQLNSIKVRTQRAGERRFVISNGQSELASYEVDLGVGVSTIEFDMQLSPGLYRIETDIETNQNNLGTDHPQFSYSQIYVDNDKRIDGYLEIKNNESNPGVSPYFFDWDVDYGHFQCEPRFPVHAIVKMPVATSDLSSNLVIYPNPSSGHVFIRTDIALPYNIDVFDFAGNKVMKRIEAGQSEILIDLPDISGMYLLKLTNDGESVVKKVYVY